MSNESEPERRDFASSLTTVETRTNRQNTPKIGPTLWPAIAYFTERCTSPERLQPCNWTLSFEDPPRFALGLQYGRGGVHPTGLRDTTALPSVRQEELIDVACYHSALTSNVAETHGCWHAGVAIGFVRMFWAAAQRGVAPVATYSLAVLSVAMSLFLAYNMAAGGNPPRKDSMEETSETLAEASPGADTVGNAAGN